MKKVLSVFILGVFLLSGSSALAFSNFWKTSSEKSNISFEESILNKIEALQEENEELKEKLEKLEKQPVTSSGFNIADMVEDTKKSVVSIIAKKDLVIYKRNPQMFDPFFHFDPFNSDPFDIFNHMRKRQYEYQEPEIEKKEKTKVGGGSGFIYSEDGLIVTNKHVVNDEESEYSVVLYDGTELDAEVLAKDPYNDIAVVKVNLEEYEGDLQPAVFGDSKKVRVGESVVAIGNALAEFENTVTSGIISALGRSIVATDRMRSAEQISDLIQTDAAINPGNSGGPLMNLKGEVIGMNTAIAERAEGIGFAIPSHYIKEIAKTVEKHGKLVRPYIGIRYIMINEENAENFGVDSDYGALIQGGVSADEPAVVKDSPADKAGLQGGDVILEVEGEKVENENGIRELLFKHSPDDTITFLILRDKEEKEIKITVGEFE